MIYKIIKTRDNYNIYKGDKGTSSTYWDTPNPNSVSLARYP
jgi:hypothetical protein